MKEGWWFLNFNFVVPGIFINWLWNCFLEKTFFFYNVFRATRYKTTSLPAALNQARRIDTLLWICIVMHVINWSRIYWRPSLCMYYAIDEGKSWIQIKLQASCRYFLYHIMKYCIRKYTKIHFCQCSILSCNGRYRWCL